MSDRRLIELQIEEAKYDQLRLREIDNQIQGRSDLGILRYRIAGHLIELKKAAKARAPLAAAVSGFGVEHPNGRWLYQYSLQEPAFKRLQETVRTSAALGKLAHGWNPAFFVLWAAEWFRQFHAGGMRRWADLEDVLGVTLPQADWRTLTHRGLSCWGRQVIHGASGRYFLSTLAREGGFPAAALTEGNAGWASTVLAAMVSAMLAEDPVSEARALEIARAHQYRMPTIFSDDDFVQLCADLALQIALLRKRADAKAEIAGIPVAAWLDAHESGWRETLPLPRVSRRSSFLEGLMTVKAHRLPKGYLEATRYLVRTDDGPWAEAVQLELDGELGDAADRHIPRGAGRLWAFPAGELSRFIPGELAYLDPSSGERSWLQSSARRDKLHLVPFSCPIELEVRSSERAELKLALPGGARVRSHLLVFTIERLQDNEPIELLLRGCGSGRYRHETVVIAAPPDWRVEAAAGGETAEKFGAGPGGSALWKIAGGALVTAPTGDAYRVLCGQAADGTDVLEVEGSTMPDFVSPADHETEIHVSPLSIRLKEGHKAVPSSGRLFMRPVGSSRWVSFRTGIEQGHFDLAWREGDILRASRRILLFPQGSTIHRRGTGSETRYTCAGRDSWSVNVADAEAPVRNSGGGRALAGRAGSALIRRFRVTVTFAGEDAGTPGGMLLDFPCGAGISDWEGRLSPPGDRITLARLKTLQAYADGKMGIFGDLIDEDGRVVRGTELRWSFEGGLPLAVIEPEVRAMLSSRGPKARVKLGMLDAIEAYWDIHQFEPAIQQDSRGFYSPVAIVDESAEFCVRSLSTYANERSLARYSLSEKGSHQPVDIPRTVHRPFLCYIRADSGVVTRPVWINGEASAGVPCDELAKAMLDGPHSRSLEDWLVMLGDEVTPSRSSLDPLVRLIASLKGIPPKTFRVLGLLPSYPAVLIRTLGAAPPEVRSAVLELESGLAFSWYLLPRRVWQSVMQEIVDDMHTRLVSAGVPDPDRYFGEMVAAFREALLQEQPSAHDLVFPGIPFDLGQAAQTLLNGHVDRIRPTSGSMFRDAGVPGLPSFFLDLPEHCLEVLDAPCAAAAAAAEKWVPDERHIERMKTVNRRYPGYFREAFAASIR